MIFDAFIIGGGVSGMQCALLLGSSTNKSFALNKNIGIVMHQRASHLDTALFNNVLGLQPNTLGKDILIQGKEQLKNLYPQVVQIDNEKVISIEQIVHVFNADGSASVFADNTNSTALASTTYSVDTSAAGYVTLTINELSGDLITISGEWIVTYCDLDILALFNNANGAAMLLVDDCE